MSEGIDLHQENAILGLRDDNLDITTRIFQICLASLHRIIDLSKNISPSKRDQAALLRCYQTLKLFAHGHGVYNGRLDEVLHRSQDLRQTMLLILNPMSKVLLDGE